MKRISDKTSVPVTLPWEAPFQDLELPYNPYDFYPLI